MILESIFVILYIEDVDLNVLLAILGIVTDRHPLH